MTTDRKKDFISQFDSLVFQFNQPYFGKKDGSQRLIPSNIHNNLDFFYDWQRAGQITPRYHNKPDERQFERHASNQTRI